MSTFTTQGLNRPVTACIHCRGVIRRNGTRWVHASTGRKVCGPTGHEVHQAQPARTWSR